MSAVRERRMEHGIVRFLDTEHRGKTASYTNWDCVQRARSACDAFERWFYRAMATRTTWNDADMNEHTLSELRTILDSMAGYVEHASLELDRIEGVDRKLERIRALRAIEGRTPEEAALYLAKAESLERGA